MPRPTPPRDPFAALLPRLRARARRLCACPSDAEDLVQDCALRLWARLQRGTPIDDLDAYAMTLMRHRRISVWRAAQETDPLEEASATCAPGALERITLAEVCAAIAALPPQQARVLRCVLAGEHSPADISRRLNIPPGTVMSRLARARAALRVACPDWRA